MKLSAFCAAVVFVGLATGASGQQPKSSAAAPVPPQILAAQRVFVSNGGGESFENVIGQTVFNGGPDRPYNQFYEAIKDWGRYELAPSPAGADLVFEVSWVLSDTGLKLPALGQLRLIVIDPKTHIVLWTFTQYVRGAVLLGNRDKNFDQAMTIVVNHLKLLAVPTAVAASGSR